MNTYLYVLLVGDGTAKVGYTAKSPRDRLSSVVVEYRGGSAELARVVLGSRDDERRIHRALRPHRVVEGKSKVVCEWYKDQSAVLEFFQPYPQAACDVCGNPWPVLRKVTRLEQLQRLHSGVATKQEHCSRCGAS